jgi:hypothetical protein
LLFGEKKTFRFSGANEILPFEGVEVFTDDGDLVSVDPAGVVSCRGFGGLGGEVAAGDESGKMGAGARRS